MWTHNLDPVLVQLGPLQIRYYGLVYVLGAFLSYWYLERARKKGTLNLTEKEVSDFVLWLLLGVLIGSRLFAVVVYSLPYYLSQPGWKVFAVWEGGMSFHGGLVGITLAGYLFCKKKNINILQIADTLSVPLMLALALGRIANFINGELWGTPTNLSWCIVFPDADSLCRHPYQLYEFIKRISIFAWLLLLSKRTFATGFLFWNLLFFEGLGRFFLDFVKEDVMYFSLGAGQWMSIVMVLIGIYMIIIQHRTDVHNMLHPPVRSSDNQK